MMMKRLMIPITSIVALLCLNGAAVSAQVGECVFGGFAEITNTDCRYQVSIDIDFSYPTWVNNYDFALQPIQDFLQITRDEFWEFASTSLDFMFTPWSLEVSYDEFAFSDSVRSTLFTVGGYSGGAHPYSYYQAFTFDLVGQRQILLVDLFQPERDPLAVISPMVQADLLVQMVDFGDAQWIEEGTGTNADNYQRFALTEDALIFFFDPYQVAPYAAGPFEVSIPLENLTAILAPEFQGVG
jgi:hypothetical protein